MSSLSVYKIVFLSHDQLIELYARAIFESDMPGFIEVEEFVFDNINGEKTDVEEKLKAEFSGVKRSFLPMHNIVRIDEVEKEGEVKVRDAERKSAKVTPFPQRLAVRNREPQDGED
ncbi:hypothetical protein SIN8267_01739 [Sinobacterium norvegicum]|uniref:DUF1820 family protein n=1 Tax=Sinobacterium norvegicum TaxID=1641715 RepID=A0ABN8EIT2_9GAMM|nr:DUF1820 family protein [Sinobacterium norvegicum]CAH0991630.1 hypothetical protein SIN8267_01739 [Sinobacterium norvegicum]